MCSIIIVPKTRETQPSFSFGMLEGGIFNPWFLTLPDKSGDPFVPLLELIFIHLYRQVSKEVKKSGEDVHLNCNYPRTKAQEGDQIPSM